MRRVPISLLLVAVLAGCRDPRADANLAQAMVDAETAITLVQQEQAILQDQVDSLRLVVAYQDTIIRRLATHTGLPMVLR